eukprot:CAMPEP_0114586868 /NCGR_PEP_ID=MMETSP0125-20121206/9981_1 /TAXON_ID=485358 ORGANISM="Aristerostoma sp., Strain ATCC 50986" /NCGR_SAMPLE_ID=MMETSP0125 /ASSEMBLY_ACC=CAM_ASM_000245 /LENGTH=65 /DNA_ID=CAMNT_0001782515 /DNA_START=76 /DNA_END=273 /DNA_ORIENTATION=+
MADDSKIPYEEASEVQTPQELKDINIEISDKIKVSDAPQSKPEIPKAMAESTSPGLAPNKTKKTV